MAGSFLSLMCDSGDAAIRRVKASDIYDEFQCMQIWEHLLVSLLPPPLLPPFPALFGLFLCYLSVFICIFPSGGGRHFPSLL